MLYRNWITFVEEDIIYREEKKERKGISNGNFENDPIIIFSIQFYY